LRRLASRRKSTVTTVRDGARQAPDLVDRNFTADQPNRLWVADITHIPTWGGFLYLAVVLDAFILGDKRMDGGNVLTRATLTLIREKIAKKAPAFAGPLTVYGEQSRVTAPTLDREGVTFKQTPYDVKARR
jgi:transposase InsO family protein